MSIEINGVGKRFGSFVALDDINLTRLLHAFEDLRVGVRHRSRDFR